VKRALLKRTPYVTLAIKGGLGRGLKANLRA